MDVIACKYNPILAAIRSNYIIGYEKCSFAKHIYGYQSFLVTNYFRTYSDTSSSYCVKEFVCKQYAEWERERGEQQGKSVRGERERREMSFCFNH